MNNQKLHFIQHELIPLLKELPANKMGVWGKMQAQQMVEHLTDFFQVSTNKIHFPLVTPAEHLPKYKEFLLSDKTFRINTKAPVLPDEPFKERHSDMEAAIQELEEEIDWFISFFENDTLVKTTLHPVFGDLNFEEWVALHYKHVMHHARQFELIKE